MIVRGVVLLLVMLCGLAHAGPTLRFVEEANWPPFTFAHEGNATEGLSYELLSEIGRRAGFSATLTLMSQTQLESELANGTADGVTVISRNAEREAKILFSDSLFQKLGYIYFRAGHVTEWNGYADLKGLRIGIARGHNLGDSFTKAVAQHGLTIEKANTDEQNFMKLAAGRLDAVMGNHWTALYLLRQPRFQHLIESARKPYYSKDYHIGLSKKSALAREWLPAINKAIKEMKADGTLDALLINHLNPDR